jgi:hypothetical protein
MFKSKKRAGQELLEAVALATMDVEEQMPSMAVAALRMMADVDEPGEYESTLGQLDEEDARAMVGRVAELVGTISAIWALEEAAEANGGEQAAAA